MRLRTWGKADVVEGELGDTGVELEEERQRLTNTTRGTKNGDFGVLHAEMLATMYLNPDCETNRERINAKHTCLAEAEKHLRWATLKA